MKLICAPMATLSHEAFRRTVEQFGGCDEYFTEMINAPSLLNMGPFEKYYLLNGPVPEKIVWQLTGTKGDSLAQAAAVVAAKGGKGIDINMGCSAPQIYKTSAGIAWMLKPREETQAAVRAVKAALTRAEQSGGQHMRLSVKCRLGAEDSTDDDVFAFTDMLVAEGVETLTLHPRTMKEKYRGLPRYEYVEKLALRYEGKVPVYLNGGIHDVQSARHALCAAPHTAGLMVARAAAQKPWIFAQLRADLLQDSAAAPQEAQTVDCRQLALDFIDNVQRYQPQEFWKTRLQRFFAYYCQNFSFAHYFQTQMLNAKSPEESRERVNAYFAQEPADQFRSF